MWLLCTLEKSNQVNYTKPYAREINYLRIKNTALKFGYLSKLNIFYFMKNIT